MLSAEPTSMGVAGKTLCFEWLLRRSQLLHVVQKCFCLFRCYTLLTVCRHVGWLLGFLTFQDCIDVLLIGQRRVEFFLNLRSVAHLTFGFVISGGIRRLCFTLSGCNAQKDHREQEDCCHRDCYVLYQFHRSSLSIIHSRFVSATSVPCGKTRKICVRFSRSRAFAHSPAKLCSHSWLTHPPAIAGGTDCAGVHHKSTAVTKQTTAGVALGSVSTGSGSDRVKLKL